MLQWFIDLVSFESIFGPKVLTIGRKSNLTLDHEKTWRYDKSQLTPKEERHLLAFASKYLSFQCVPRISDANLQ